jgi:predicted GTPase
MSQRVLILGAAGRDFHNFNTVFRDNPAFEVVAFTATQIPNITDRRYPRELAGSLYPNGIPILPEEDLERVVAEQGVEVVVFSYSDVSHEHVMHVGSRVLAAGADYWFLGPRHTALRSRVPVVAVCAARTGSGKSQTSRRVAEILGTLGQRVVVVRHPMPYGDLARQAVQRFETYDDLARHDVTIEEREEYEPHLDRGTVVYAGVDYERILREAEKEADIVLWDGGNNDLPFFKSDFHIVVVDPHRPGHEIRYHPGEANVRLADVVVINKIDTAQPEAITEVRDNVRWLNPKTTIIEAASPIWVDHPEQIQGKRVLVIEDGPTLTHGEMQYGAGVVAAQRFGAAELVDPHSTAVGTIAETFKKYPTTGRLLPAMGYGQQQRDDLQETINRTDADLVLIATPTDLTRLIQMNKPSQRVRYELQEIGQPTLAELLQNKFGTK